LIKIPRLADQVKRNIRERDILLQDRSMTSPLAIAMTHHQRVVAQV
jgi:hypothetical protein